MPKSKEELNAIKEEVETVNKKLQELTPEEIAQVTGGSHVSPFPEPFATEPPIFETAREDYVSE